MCSVDALQLDIQHHHSWRLGLEGISLSKAREIVPYSKRSQLLGSRHTSGVRWKDVNLKYYQTRSSNGNNTWLELKERAAEGAQRKRLKWKTSLQLEGRE